MAITPFNASTAASAGPATAAARRPDEIQLRARQVADQLGDVWGGLIAVSQPATGAAEIVARIERQQHALAQAIDGFRFLIRDDHQQAALAFAQSSLRSTVADIRSGAQRTDTWNISVAMQGPITKVRNAELLVRGTFDVPAKAGV